MPLSIFSHLILIVILLFLVVLSRGLCDVWVEARGRRWGLGNLVCVEFMLTDVRRGSHCVGETVQQPQVIQTSGLGNFMGGH